MSSPRTPARVLVVGYGTVGRALVRLIGARAEAVASRWGVAIEVVGIVRRGATDPALPAELFANDAVAAIAARKPDVVVELTGTVGPSREIILAALRAGAHVVTANKAVLAAHGHELQDTARHEKRLLLAEASVGGAIPIMRSLHTSLAGDEPLRILGIWNGTCNYILTRMAEDRSSFAAALAEAQRLGYAEPDPALDVGGGDTMHKATVLAQLGFGVYPDHTLMETRGITDVREDDFNTARELQSVIKLVGLIEDQPGGVLMYAGPALLPDTHPLASVRGVQNGIHIDGHVVEDVFLSGPGAGPGPTAVTVLGDVIEAARLGRSSVGRDRWGKRPAAERAQPILSFDTVPTPLFLRLLVPDRSGVIAAVATIMAKYDISIDSFDQPHRHRRDAVPIYMTTHAAPVGRLKEALTEILSLDYKIHSPLWMPMLEIEDEPE